MTSASLLASEVSVVLLLLDVRVPFVYNNISLADNIAFKCQPFVFMCPDFFWGTPWVLVNVDNPKKDNKEG